VIFQHRFLVHAPLKKVAEFHSRSASMADITPPPVLVRIHQSPAILSEGNEMKFTLWVGPLPIHWHAHMENVSKNLNRKVVQTQAFGVKFMIKD